MSNKRIKHLYATILSLGSFKKFFCVNNYYIYTFISDRDQFREVFEAQPAPNVIQTTHVHDGKYFNK